MELLEQVKLSEKTKHLWRDNHQSTEWRNANKLNILLFGMPLNNKPKCKCLEDLFFMLKSKNINQKFTQKMEQKFKVQKGKVISSHKFGFHITEHSTDEQIQEALKLEPSLIKYMEKVPENFGNEEIEVLNSQEELGIEEMTKKDLIEFAELNEIEVDKRQGRTKILEAIQNHLNG